MALHSEAYFLSLYTRKSVSQKHGTRKRRPQTGDLEKRRPQTADLENTDLENALEIRNASAILEILAKLNNFINKLGSDC